MKKALVIIFCFLYNLSFGQNFTEKSISTTIKEVTVFIDGCQINREATTELPKGNILLKFTGISPFIDAKSIQLKTDGDLTILSVNTQMNYVQKNGKDKKVDSLERYIEKMNNDLYILQANKAALNDRLNFLTANIKIGGDSQTVNTQQLKDAYKFYNESTLDVRLKLLEYNKKISDSENELAKHKTQLKTLSTTKEQPLNEILVKVENKKQGKFKFGLSYLANNASWLPSYDINAKNINEPIRLTYKANIKQETKEDWKNVKLKLSSANPNNSGIAPQLQTYFIGYGVQAPTYNNARMGKSNQIAGQIFDKRGETIPFVTVMVSGTTIGTEADENGRYTLTLPNNQSNLYLVFKSAGFKDLITAVNNRQIINANMEADIQTLEAAVVVGYGQNREIGVPTGGYSKKSSKQPQPNIKIRGVSSLKPTETQQIRNQTSVDFEIKTPYTIPSDGKSYTVSIEEYNVPATYEYYCAPKADRDVFLNANITNWEHLNLLEGEANIFFENTYIGKTLIDTRIASDTLTFSLGRDKGVVVTRELQKNYTTKQFIGSKKEETRAWKITVRNNKSDNINLQLVDQVPVSKFSEVDIKHVNISKGKLNNETGQIVWNLNLPTKQSKEYDITYQVKYPKTWGIVIE